MYPSYSQIQKAKFDCYPDENAIHITDASAKINLQALLDHTSCRILKLLNENSIQSENLILLTKWGCDGVSGQSQYKQKFDNTCDDDASVFITTIVPLILYDKNKFVLWENPSPSSTNYCRPLYFQFIHENTALIQQEVRDINQEINTLSTTTCLIGAKKINITHNMILSMVDGKVVNAVCKIKSAMTCNICGAKPTEMNDLSNIYKKNAIEEYYKYGISILHGWIRCFECLLHISYNISFRSWSARTTEHKEMKKKEKERIQAECKEKMGLKVDIIKQGVGTTNNTNNWQYRTQIL